MRKGAPIVRKKGAEIEKKGRQNLETRTKIEKIGRKSRKNGALIKKTAQKLRKRLKYEKI